MAFEGVNRTVHFLGCHMFLRSPLNCLCMVEAFLALFLKLLRERQARRYRVKQLVELARERRSTRLDMEP